MKKRSREEEKRKEVVERSDNERERGKIEGRKSKKERSREEDKGGRKGSKRKGAGSASTERSESKEEYRKE